MMIGWWLDGGRTLQKFEQVSARHEYINPLFEEGHCLRCHSYLKHYLGRRIRLCSTLRHFVLPHTVSPRPARSRIPYRLYHRRHPTITIVFIENKEVYILSSKHQLSYISPYL